MHGMTWLVLEDRWLFAPGWLVASVNDKKSSNEDKQQQACPITCGLDTTTLMHIWAGHPAGAAKAGFGLSRCVVV